MAYIFEMLRYGSRNVNLVYRDAETLHQSHSVVICPVCRSEAGHRNADNPLPAHTELVESLHAYQKGERRVQSTTDSQDDILAVCMHDSFCKSGNLYAEYLLATFLHVVV